MGALGGASGCDVVRVADAGGGVRVVEAAVFEGGYGIHWHQKVAERFNAERTGWGVRVELWGDPRMRDKLKPRILRGDPPDLIIDQVLPIWMMIGAGKVRPFDDVLDRPTATGETWREQFTPGTLDVFSSGGKVYAVPSSFGAWSCWYDARLFRERGWTVPRTWGEFTALCDRIQSEGIAPIAFQGKYPYYGWWTYISLVQRCGGLEAINRMNALEPGAFSHPDAVRAARLWQEAATTYFQKGAMAMTHTESQFQFVNNKAAMVFCGTWLENEQKATIPPDFELRCFTVPAVEGGKGNPRLFNGLGMECMFVPSESNHPDLGAEFAAYLVSKENAADMGRSIGIISPLKGACPREALSPALQSVLDMIEHAEGIFDVRLDKLLLTWQQQVLNPSLGKLLQGAITPEEFGAALDRGIAEAKANPDVIIPPFKPYDPAAFGEPVT